jgi:acyl-CoA synthetase (AMP-forming)/AMP-acid ligase II
MNVGYDAVTHRPSDMPRASLSIETDRPMTYAELIARRNTLAEVLGSAGIQPGDRVGMFMENDIDYWPLYLAITLVGAVCVRLNFRWAAQELTYAVADSGCSTLFVHQSLSQVADEAFYGAGRSLRFITFEANSRDSLDAALSLSLGVQAEIGSFGDQLEGSTDDAMIMYTSGTTGRPKGVIWTHASTLSFAAMQILQWNFCLETVSLTVGPAYHVGSFEDLALPTLMAGGHTVMMRSKDFSLKRAASIIAAKRVTDVLLFPAMLRELLDQHLADRYDLTSLRRIITGGSSLRSWVVRELAAQLPDVGVHNVYGLTEGGGMSTSMDPAELGSYPDGVGRPLPLARVRITREDGTAAGCDESGEICVSGPNVARGYLHSEDTATAWVEGWLRTGDLGRLNADGILHLVGRVKDMVRTGDENVYSAEVEQIISSHPCVADVAVIGIPDEQWGEIVCAVVISQDGLGVDAAEIRNHCQSQLASYKKPKVVITVDDLPRNSTGKVDKARLREMYSSRLAAEYSKRDPDRKGP